MFKHSLFWISLALLTPSISRSTESLPDCGRALAEMNEPTFSQEWDFTSIRDSFEALETRARAEKVEGLEE
jgi:hypothetical protein